MRGPHNIIRLVRIGATFERTGAMKVVLNTLDLHPNLRLAARLIGRPFALFGLSGDPAQPPILRAITALGPAYIKFGQLFSTRPDLVGQELATELRVLQDKLPPFPTEIAKKTVEDELGIKVDEVFSEFSEPVAAASIAQVHRARLREDGREVAVKILRPQIERAFKKDVDGFYLVAWLANALAPPARRLRPQDVVDHFEGVVLRELDLRVEAAAVDRFGANNAGEKGVVVPAVNWWLSSRRVITIDWADGINLADVKALSEAGHDLRKLAVRIIQMFLRHVLRDGFFHADMHQGNVKISCEGEIVLLDFGIMGQIDSETRRVYAEILMGFISRDYDRVAKVHFEAGYVPTNQSVDDFSQALRSVGEPIFGMDASRISMARLLLHLFEVTERFGMETRTELILLQRTMVVVEGVSRTLDPKTNMWEAAQPVVEEYIRTNIGPGAIVRDLAKLSRTLSRLGPRLIQAIEATALPQPHPQTPPPGFPWRSAFAALMAGIAFAAAMFLIA